MIEVVVPKTAWLQIFETHGTLKTGVLLRFRLNPLRGVQRMVE